MTILQVVNVLAFTFTRHANVHDHDHVHVRALGAVALTRAELGRLVRRLGQRRLPVVVRMLVASVVLVCAPVVIVWSMGIYDRFEERRHKRALRRIEEAATAVIRARGAQGFEARLERFARKHKVQVRLLDLRGELVAASAPEPGEGRISGRTWFARSADFFFGPEGPPRLREQEQTRGGLAQRPEVVAALSGRAEEAFVGGDSAFVFYRAFRVGERVVYLTRLSRRSVRSLYDFRYQLLKLTLAMLAGGLFMGVWMGWSVVGPIGRLSSRIRGYMETGQRPTLALERQDEIGQISRDFEALAQRLETRLERTAKVTADFAHDLKNPISAVGASAELLEGEGPLNAERRARMAKAMGQAAEHMRRAVDAMLALARLDERLPHEPKALVQLEPLLSVLIEDYRARPDLAKITLELNVIEGAAVHGIEARLGELVRNLVDNALVFAKTRVQVELLHEEGLVLRVSDDGPGVSQGNRTKIFGRFFSARPEGAPMGSGLGLSIVQTIAEAHDAQLVLLDSGTLGGASFEVRFSAH